MDSSALRPGDILLRDAVGAQSPAESAQSARCERPSDAEIREAVHRITSGNHLDATARLRHLLEYLVSETLEGRGNRIKAYSIATEVLGRPASFDPQKDPIVRIEAARLRRVLEHYYLTDGRDDQVIISIPKGAYVPHFSFARRAAVEFVGAGTVPPRGGLPAANGSVANGTATFLAFGIAVVLLVVGMAWSGWLPRPEQGRTSAGVLIPGLVIKPLADLSRDGNSAVIAEGLSERIIEKASRFKELAVIANSGGPLLTPTSVARYEFGGALRTGKDSLLVQVRLADRTDGRVIWADSYEVAMKPQQLFNVEVEIADQIVTRIAEPSGILFEVERRRAAEVLPENWDAYFCTLSAYAYRGSYAAGQYGPVKACLEKAVAEHPDYATAWALLSLLYIDEVRFAYVAPSDTQAALVRAYDAASRAVAIDPADIRGQQAMMMALFFRGDYAAALEVGKRAYDENPNDIDLKGEYGFRLALAGNWTEGCLLIQSALNSSSRKLGYYKTTLSLCDYFANDLASAAALINDADAGENPSYHVIAAAILAEAGDTAKAGEHKAWLEKNANAQLPRLLTDIPQRLVRPEDRQRFVDSLRKAGFTPGS